MSGYFPIYLEWLGVAVFALTGALTAARKGMDPLGFALLATVTGVGGGTLREVLLGRPATWIADPTAPAICIIIGFATFAIGRSYTPTRKRAFRMLMWADGLGLAIFAVSGAQTALLASAHPVTAIVLGALTATFGGVVRDVLAGEIPLVLRREIYVTAAALGAGVLCRAGIAWAGRPVGGAGLGCGRLYAARSGHRPRLVDAGLPAERLGARVIQAFVTRRKVKLMRPPCGSSVDVPP